MEEVKGDDKPVTKSKPKFHIWNQILEDDELSEKLTASMNKFGDEFARRFIKKKRNKKNKKKKKGKKDSTTTNVSSTNGNINTNGTTIQSKDLKPEKPVNIQPTVQSPSKSQQTKKPHQKWNNQRQGGSSKRKEKLSNRVLTEEAENISRKLKEKRIDLIIRTIRFLGLEEAMKLCSEVLTIEEAGGLMTMNGTRRRTPGGIFFHLIRSNGRYDASIVSKLFKEGENKEPVFKSRNKTRTTSKTASATKPNASFNLANGMTSSDLNGATIGTIEPIQSILLTIQSANPEQNQQETAKITQPIDSVNLMSSNVAVVASNPDVKMEEDEDDLENSNLVIVENDSNGNADQKSEQLVNYTFSNHPNSPDLNILCQLTSSSTINTEAASTINQNISMFTTNSISVDA